MPIRPRSVPSPVPPPVGARVPGGATAAEHVDATHATHEIHEHRAPADVYAAHEPSLVSPSEKLAGTFLGYRFDPKDVDAVMKKHGIGDVKALLRVAITLHRAGDRFLSVAELERAAQETASYARGVRFSPSALADVMKQTGIAEQGALVRGARSLDDGDKVLSRAELEAAAALLHTIVRAHDVDEVHARVRAHERNGDVTVQEIGKAGADPILAMTLPSTKQPPKHRVLVTGGVHGNEPCGTAAALLILEQMLRSPKLREEVELVVVPLVNPRGLREGTRRTPEDVDLNRTFADAHAPHETHAIRDFVLSQQTSGAFDLAVDLHSGGAARNGFWLLHDDAQDAASFAMKRFGETWPALSEDAKPYTLTSPGVAESTNAGTLKSFAKDTGTPLSFTVEAPGSVAYLDQVLGEAELVAHLIDAARR